MSIVRWMPRRSLFDFSDEFQRIWSDFLPAQLEGDSTVWQPSVDIDETKDEYQVIAELPGLTEKDVKIMLKDKHLVISGEKKVEAEKNENDYHFSERCYGKFERAFVLPTEVVADKVEAKVKDGILKIILPKSEKVKPTEIAIKAA